jgi:hypothetical protein
LLAHGAAPAGGTSSRGLQPAAHRVGSER